MSRESGDPAPGADGREGVGATARLAPAGGPEDPPAHSKGGGAPAADRGPRGWSRPSLPCLILVVAVLAFTVGWTWIDWLRYASFNMTIYDIGVNYHLIWSLAHGAGILSRGTGGIHPSMTYPIDLLFAPVLPLFPSEGSFLFALILFQAGFLALGALAIYGAVVDRWGDRWAGLGLGLAYLAVPAVCGPVWFPFHFEAMLPTLFLLAYWQHGRGHYGRALGLWTLALTTNIGAPLVVGAYAVGLLVEPWLARRGWWERIRHRPRPAPSARSSAAVWRAVYLLSASVTVFVLICLALLPGEGLAALEAVFTQSSGPTLASLSAGAQVSPWVTAGDQAITVLLLLAPLLFLPFWGRAERWATLPFFAHLLVLGNPGAFLWPFSDQYVSFVLPGIFAAAIRSLERPWGRTRPSLGPPLSAAAAPTVPLRRGRRFAFRRPTSAVLAAAILVGAVFSAWGPVNLLAPWIPGLSPGYYPFGTQIASDPVEDSELHALIESIPAEGTLLVQNNLVQAMDRWNYVVPGFYTPNASVAYVLTDPYNLWFSTENTWGPSPTPMIVWANDFLEAGWTARGEASGAMLLAPTWSGPPEPYYPVNEAFPSGVFTTVAAPASEGAWSGGVTAQGPVDPGANDLTTLTPGTFALTVHVGIVKATPWVNVEVTVGSAGGAVTLSTFVANVSTSPSHAQLNVTFSPTVAQYYLGMNFDIRLVGAAAGAVAFDGLSWVQTAA